MAEKKPPAWIEVIPEADAEGDLADVYAQNMERWGGVDHIIKIHSLSVPAMQAHVQLYRTAMYGKSPIRRPEREMIGVVVSAINQCHY